MRTADEYKENTEDKVEKFVNITEQFNDYV